MKAQKKLAARVWDAVFGPQPKTEKRHAAARTNRLNSGWTTQPTGANYETRMSLSVLIARAREAARDSLHIVNYLRLMRSNVIGQTGIGLQCRARLKNGKLNLKLNSRIEEAWWEWTHAENCTVSGGHDWKGVQDLAVTQCETDGAFLIQMIEDAPNPFGFSLKLWDVTWLDPTFNVTVPGRNRILMSVEIDADNKPVAYWMTTPQSETEYTPQQSQVRWRIPAEQIIHNFQHRAASQVQGIPGIAPALLPAKNAYSYEESVIMAARHCVNDFAVLKNTTPDADADWDGAENDDGSPNHPLIDSAPLSITALLPGWEMEWRDAKHPTQNHPAFSQTLDMKIAASLGVPYFLLIGDWTAVNFSSSRGGLGEFRERCRGYQAFIATTLCRRVFHAWLRAAWLTGKIEITAAEYQELQNPTWQPRGFDYVDPKKDVETDILQLQYRLKTPSQIALERGEDYLDQLERWQSDEQLAKAKGRDINAIYSPKQAAAAPPDGEDDPPDDTEKPKKPDDGED